MKKNVFLYLLVIISICGIFLVLLWLQDRSEDLRIRFVVSELKELKEIVQQDKHNIEDNFKTLQQNLELTQGMLEELTYEFDKKIDAVLEEIVQQDGQDTEGNFINLQQKLELTQGRLEELTYEIDKKIDAVLEGSEENRAGIAVNRGQLLQLKADIEEYNTFIAKKLNLIENTILESMKTGKTDELPDLSQYINPAEGDSTAVRAMSEGKAAYLASHYNEAYDLFKKVLEIQPDNIEARSYWGASLFHKSSGDSSEYLRIAKNLKLVLEKDPDNELALTIMAGISIERNDDIKTEEYYNRLIYTNPDLIEPYITLGKIFIRKNDFATADKYLEEAMKRAPEDYIVSYYLGVSAREQNSMYKALGCFTKSIELNSDFLPAYLQQGLAYLQMGKEAEGISPLKYYTTYRKEYSAFMALGDCYSATNNSECAYSAYKSALNSLVINTAEDREKAATARSRIAELKE